jgi:hypothetical protein
MPELVKRLRTNQIKASIFQEKLCILNPLSASQRNIRSLCIARESEADIVLKSILWGDEAMAIDYGSEITATQHLHFDDWDNKPTRQISKVDISDVRYALDQLQIRDERGPYTVLDKQELKNPSDVDMTLSRTLRLMDTVTSNWSAGIAAPMGVPAQTTFSSGIPLAKANASVEISSPLIMSSTWGGSYTQQIMRVARVEADVPPRTSVFALLMCKPVRITLPYTARAVIQFDDGKTATTDSFRGVYEGTSLSFYFEVRSGTLV